MSALSRTNAREPRANRAGATESAFTLLELIIVMAVIGILAAVAMPRLMNVPRKANEAALKVDLHTMRSMIDQFYADHGHYPPSLTALVEEGYIRDLPIDPFTRSNETWVEIYEEVDPEEEPAETDLPEDGSLGVWDVASGAEILALDGESYYSEW